MAQAVKAIGQPNQHPSDDQTHRTTCARFSWPGGSVPQTTQRSTASAIASRLSKQLELRCSTLRCGGGLNRIDQELQLRDQGCPGCHGTTVARTPAGQAKRGHSTQASTCKGGATALWGAAAAMAAPIRGTALGRLEAAANEAPAGGPAAPPASRGSSREKRDFCFREGYGALASPKVLRSDTDTVVVRRDSAELDFISATLELSSLQCCPPPLR